MTSDDAAGGQRPADAKGSTTAQARKKSGKKLGKVEKDEGDADLEKEEEAS